MRVLALALTIAAASGTSARAHPGASGCLPATLQYSYVCGGAWFTVTVSARYRMSYTGHATSDCGDAPYTNAESYDVATTQTIDVSSRPLHVFVVEVSDLVPTSRAFHPRQVRDLLLELRAVAANTRLPAYRASAHVSSRVSAPTLLTRSQRGTYTNCPGDPQQSSPARPFPAARCARLTVAFNVDFVVLGGQPSFAATAPSSPYTRSGCRDAYVEPPPDLLRRNDVPDNTVFQLVARPSCPPDGTFLAARPGATLSCRYAGVATNVPGREHTRLTVSIRFRRTS